MSEKVIYLPPPGLKVNMPTEEGFRVGKILAETVACPTHEMCADCVFRHGSFPNGCEQTLDDAMKCMIDPKEHGVFVCAHRSDGTQPICGGYAHAMKNVLLPMCERPDFNPEPFNTDHEPI